MTTSPPDHPAPAAPDFEAIALPLLDDVARFARSLTRDATDADDLVQETFLKAYRGWHTFQAGSDARAWLFTIARNCWVRQRPRVERQMPVADADLEALAAVRAHAEAREDGLEALWAASDLGDAIRQGFAALPEHFRAVAELVDVQDLAYEEVARVLDIPIGTVRSRLFRARRLLQDHLIQHARDLGIVATRGGKDR